MKRCWIGAGILALLLFLSLGVWKIMEGLHGPVAAALEEACQAAASQELPRAERALAQAQALWQRHSGLRGCFADHGPMEEVDAALLRLRGQLKTGQREEFVAEAMAATAMVRNMARAHSPLWWNVF